MSRSSYPKQFVNLGTGQTLFKNAIARSISFSSSVKDLCVLAVTNSALELTAKYALDECNVKSKIIVEPSQRNTAAAIAAAAFYSIRQDSEAILFVLPSDQFVENQSNFDSTVKRAIKLAGKDFLVTFGVKPTSPETGFGYIKAGSLVDRNGFEIEKFVEKPDIETAKQMFDAESYYWNSGMFVFRAKTFLDELNRYAPKIYNSVNRAVMQGTETESSFRLDKKSFEKAPSIAVDYAVMEKTKKGVVVPLTSTWKDLGSWKSFYDIGSKDSSGNVQQGDVLLKDCKNSYIRSTKRFVAAIGISNLAIVETGDALLISSLDRTQEVKDVFNHLMQSCREEASLPPLVYRPWGNYEKLTVGDRFKVKRIVVQPNSELSLQLHHHRAEHWVIVEGTAEVQIGETIQTCTENESVYIPVGSVHRLRNPGKIPLVVIEVQTGAYLEEDDIVRLEDKYNRS